jgi:hypothetical protein
MRRYAPVKKRSRLWRAPAAWSVLLATIGVGVAALVRAWLRERRPRLATQSLPISRAAL